MYRALTNVNKVRSSRATCIQSIACQWSGMVKKHGRYTSAYDRVLAAGDSWTQITEDNFVPLRRKSGKQSRFFKYEGKCRDNSQRRPDGPPNFPPAKKESNHFDFRWDTPVTDRYRKLFDKETFLILCELEYDPCVTFNAYNEAAPKVQFLEEYEPFVSFFENLNGNRA